MNHTINNGNSRALLLVRVSTLKQDFDEQERELYQLALNDGFTDDDIIPICEKESGIKLSEEDRKGLNRLKEEINKGGVKCVYAWEPSRIARKKKVIFSITDYLVERGIQLVIKEPYIRLLNPDGTINDGAETVLTLFGQLAESEMRNKQARWRRTRIANSAAGVWNGGARIRFGYTVDDKNRYIIDENEAAVVRLVYELYTTTHMGMTHLYRELIRRGINISRDMVGKILNFKGYTGSVVNSPTYFKVDGKWQTKKGYDLVYPAIITAETFELAEQKKTGANRNADKGAYYYFAKGLVKCSMCGYSYLGYKHLGVYMCLAHKHDNPDIKKCDNNASININVLDTILWDITSSEYIAARQQTTAEMIEQTKKDIEVCRSIIAATDAKIQKAQQKRKRYAMIFADGDLTDEEYQQAKMKIEDEIRVITVDKLNAEAKIEQLEKVLTSTQSPNYIDMLKEMVGAVFSMSDLREMSELVHTYLTNVTIENCTLKGPRTKHITVNTVSGTMYEYLARYNPGTHVQHIYRKVEQLLPTVFDEWVEVHPEIIIQREIGKGVKGNKVEIIRSDKPYYSFVPEAGGRNTVRTTVASGKALNKRVWKAVNEGIATVQNNADGSKTITYHGTDRGACL